jgi:hypothetical protein
LFKQFLSTRFSIEVFEECRGAGNGHGTPRFCEHIKKEQKVAEISNLSVVAHPDFWTFRRLCMSFTKEK